MPRLVAVALRGVRQIYIKVVQDGVERVYAEKRKVAGIHTFAPARSRD